MFPPNFRKSLTTNTVDSAIPKSMAPYVGVSQQPPTTMMDLEMAAMPSKSIDTIIQCSSDSPIPSSSSHAKIESAMIQSSKNQYETHPSTQVYIQLQDDLLTATTMNHATTMQNTLVVNLQHQTRQNTIAKSQKTGAITNAIGSNSPLDTSQATSAPSLDGSSTTPQVIWPNCNLFPNHATPSTNTIPHDPPA